MTPKEKAIELIELFTFSCRECDNSKISALIAVDEILEDNRISYMLLGVGINKYYWEEVKKEIEAL